MRVVLSKESKLNLLFLLKEKNNCETLKDLADKLNIKKKTLESWFYSEKVTVPYEMFDKYIQDIKIIKKKEDNWGRVLGGKKGHQALLRKYGSAHTWEINSLGGKNGAKTKEIEALKFKLDISDPQFLEVFGALLGDGWLNSPRNPDSRWTLGLCGNLKLDKEYVQYCSRILISLTNRKGFFQEKPIGNVIEFRFGHKQFFKILNEQLNFPAGKKENLIIPEPIYSQGYDKVKYVIRGIFDTDGSFYLDKDKGGVPHYPCISIHMTEPLLLNQLAEIFKEQGFKFYFDRVNNQIKLRGMKQLRKWMKEIGSSNSKHLNKITACLDQSR